MATKERDIEKRCHAGLVISAISNFHWYEGGRNVGDLQSSLHREDYALLIDQS